MTWTPIDLRTFSMSAPGRIAILRTRKGSMLYRLELHYSVHMVVIEGIGGTAALKRARGFCG